MSNKISRKKIDKAFELFCSTRLTLDAENWSQKLQSFIGEFSNFSGTDFEDRIFSGWVAAICEQSYYAAAHRKDLRKRKEFEKTIKQVFRNMDIPHCLINSNFVLCGKKQPSLIDSIEPTLDRYSVLEEFPSIFSGSIDAIILGGSMSYVPFLGVRSDYVNNDFSDIDLIFIQNDSFFDKDSWDSFRSTTLLYSDEKETFIKRVNEYKKLLSEGRADIISQRFRIRGKKYTVSTHFFPKNHFKKLVNTKLAKKLSSMDEYDYPVRNYRADAFYHPCQARLSFDGSRIESGVWPESNNVKCGHIVSTSGFTIKNKKLYPGPFLTVVLPALQVFYSKSSFAEECLKKLEVIIDEQVSEHSAHSRPVSYAKAHHRYYLFCPGRYDAGHDSYVSPIRAKKLYVVDPLTILSACNPKGKDENLKPEITTSIEYKNIRKELETCKQRELDTMNKSIDSFMKHGYQHNLDISLFKKTYWITVATVIARENIVINKPDGSKYVATYALSPNDIMSSISYSRLSNKLGKVYISSHFDPIESENLYPVRYSIIVKLC
jgi:hypothetical protein